MSNGELNSYIELAESFYADLTEWCNSQTESDLYINSGKVDTLQLKVNIITSLNDVVFGLRQNNHIARAARLEDAIANARKAVEDYDNGIISGDQLIDKVLPITGELTALCRPAVPQKPFNLIADEVKSMEKKDKESLSSCVKKLTELAKRVTYWVESIKSSKSYSSLNTLQLKFKVVEDRLRTILICMESNNLPALAARLEREYGNLIKMTEYFDKLCKEPNHKDIKPGDLETAPQELQIVAGSFVSLLDEIAKQLLSATEETIKPAEKQAEAE